MCVCRLDIYVDSFLTTHKHTNQESLPPINSQSAVHYISNIYPVTIMKYIDHLSAISVLSKNLESWESGVISVTVATSLNDDTPMSINLTNTLGYQKNPPSERWRSDRNCYWLPSTFNINTEVFRVEEIYPLFKQACKAAGFKVGGRYEKNRYTIIFQCVKGRFHYEGQNKKHNDNREINVKRQGPPKPKAKKTERSLKTKEEVCPFRFCVYWCSVKERWYFPHMQRRCASHIGHINVDSSLVRLHADMAGSAHERQIAKDALECEVAATATSSLFEKRTGHCLEWYQVHYLKSKNKNRLMMGGTDTTAADRLVAWLSSDKSRSFILLFAEYDSDLITIKTKKRHLNNAVEINTFEEDLGDNTDNPKAWAKSMKGSLFTQQVVRFSF